MHEHLSRLHDGDLEIHAATALLDRLLGDLEARDRWTRYQLAGDVLRGNPTPDDGFSLRILERLEGVQREPGFDPLAS